ncbi:hypothetical protein Acr_24g0008730 [Actinidia rufa]|uniref:Uncharacterized protein n=1 Tax=Actinidia rufa TaxID=165716 RepID=A0A7J0GV62_9ERIC|nr:hypothetical protein Acr_24g0008730 [Actinidia rufa]
MHVERKGVGSRGLMDKEGGGSGDLCLGQRKDGQYFVGYGYGVCPDGDTDGFMDGLVGDFEIRRKGIRP